MSTEPKWLVENTAIVVGDWVRPAESSVVMAGQVVAFPNETHAIVEWQKGMRSTHRRVALELVMQQAELTRNRVMSRGTP